MGTYVYVCIAWMVYVTINYVYFIVRRQHVGTYFLLRKWGWSPGCYGELSRGFGVEGVRRCEEVWARRWGALM